eukprot:3746591-Rhodomonas_salina.2
MSTRTPQATPLTPGHVLTNPGGQLHTHTSLRVVPNNALCVPDCDGQERGLGVYLLDGFLGLLHLFPPPEPSASPLCWSTASCSGLVVGCYQHCCHAVRCELSTASIRWRSTGAVC